MGTSSPKILDRFTFKKKVFIILNVDFAQPDRRRAAFSFFKHKHFDVVLVQETHWTNNIPHNIEHDWGGEVVNNGRIATTIITITRGHLI